MGMTFKEVSAELEKALDAATVAKKELTKSEEVLKKAGTEYQNAVARAADMRVQMNALLDASLPASEIKPKIG